MGYLFRINKGATGTKSTIVGMLVNQSKTT